MIPCELHDPPRRPFYRILNFDIDKHPLTRLIRARVYKIYPPATHSHLEHLKSDLYNSYNFSPSYRP